MRQKEEARMEQLCVCCCFEGRAGQEKSEKKKDSTP